MTTVAAESLAATPAWRREPYRIFFPLGFALTWAGVLHWALVAVGVLDGYHAVFHSIVQIQGFLMCFAVGFLFTAIPRRTQTSAPAGWQIIACVLCPIGTAISAWYEVWAVSQLFWFVLVSILVGFVLRRFLATDAGRSPPASFVWVPISLATGVIGSLLTAMRGILGHEGIALHDFGRLLVTQGMFVGLVLGIGGMVIPLLTRGESAPDSSEANRGARALHVLAALSLIGTFALENWQSSELGYATRAIVTALVLVFGCHAYRRPTRTGWHRWIVWLSPWCMPIGYTLAALDPVRQQAGLHVVFIGCFAMLTLTVGLHVTLAHGFAKELVFGRPWQVPVYAGLLLVAIMFRGLAHYDRGNMMLWLGLAATAFLLGTLFWASLMLRGLIPRPSE